MKKNLYNGNQKNNSTYLSKEKLEEISERFRSVREQHFSTQSELVERAETDNCKISKSSLSRYESGDTYISLEALIWICNNCHVSADYILFGTKHEESKIFNKALSRINKEGAQNICTFLELIIQALKEKFSI